MTIPFKSIVLVLLAAGLYSASCEGDPLARRDNYYQEAQTYAQEEKYEEASIQLQNVLKLDPEFTEGHFQLGVSYRRIGQLRKAQEALRKALELNPNHTGAALELAEIYLLVRVPAEARQLALEVLEREPDNFSAQLQLARSYMIENDFVTAKEEFEKARQMNPNNPRGVVMTAVNENQQFRRWRARGAADSWCFKMQICILAGATTLRVSRVLRRPPLPHARGAPTAAAASR